MGFEVRFIMLAHVMTTNFQIPNNFAKYCDGSFIRENMGTFFMEGNGLAVRRENESERG